MVMCVDRSIESQCLCSPRLASRHCCSSPATVTACESIAHQHSTLLGTMDIFIAGERTPSS